ncbi:hypothetical protein EYF80_049193 [Liparis tanakae]|uniref:Uncharacterized protein n=1 Tax=Liparis tanakae TaxID=230148 RepID=A0A4Z2FI81_9TELE|nr:hypothetical protein EYF80_049193 [Liparis tanakae]
MDNIIVVRNALWPQLTRALNCRGTAEPREAGLYLHAAAAVQGTHSSSLRSHTNTNGLDPKRLPDSRWVTKQNRGGECRLMADSYGLHPGSQRWTDYSLPPEPGFAPADPDSSSGWLPRACTPGRGAAPCHGNNGVLMHHQHVAQRRRGGVAAWRYTAAF